MLPGALKVVAGVVPALLVLELVIRQFWVHSRVWEPGYVKIPTPDTKSVWCTEGCGVTHRLSKGERAGYPADAPAVLVLGDSFTEALEVNDDEVYTHVAQEALAKVGIRLGFVNAGLAGRSVADYVGFADRHKKLFSPAWTVVTLRDDDLAEDTERPAKTAFKRDAGGRLQVSFDEDRTAPGVRDALWNAPSIFVRYSAYRLHKFVEAAEAEPPMFFAASHEGRKAPPTDYAQYAVEEELDLLRAAYGGKVTVVTLPYILFKAGGEPTILDSNVRRRLLSYCKATGMSCVEPSAAFLAMARGYRSPFGFPNSQFNYGHMNPDGHRIVGEELAKELQRLKVNAVF